MLNKTRLISIGHFTRSALILLCFLYLGKALQYLTHVPIPGSIFGLLMLFIALNARILPLHLVLPSGNFLLSYITLFFVPVGVGLLQYTELLSNHWFTIIVSSVVSTLAVLVGVGWIYQRLVK
ncbi:CidA/LrgA family protein [Colwellia sp. KU-HH00111]|uniref:CidA/LrgA family protein n=1 Tax=Colwellia sp. KU-HH00111 TaxID=3127652 RepID=UPI0033658623